MGLANYCNFGSYSTSASQSVFPRLAGGTNSVHPQILHYLSVMIKCVGDGKCGQMQAGRFVVLRGLQHVLSNQRSRGLVTQGKGILQELNNVGLGLQDLRAVPALEVFRDLIAGKRRP
jgi:hypothetical protein